MTTEPRFARALVWFRRDLRDFDHAALALACERAERVFCAFVFDREILDRLPTRADRRVEFIWESVRSLDSTLRKRGGGLIVRHAVAREAIPRLAVELAVEAVFANRDYEPQAIARDRAVERALAAQDIVFVTSKDQVIFECDELVSKAGTPFSVFTPYKRAWLGSLDPDALAPRDTECADDKLAAPPALDALPDLATMGFVHTDLASLGVVPGMSGGGALFHAFRERVEGYHEARDFPSRRGGSFLSVHIRFGTVSVRSLVAFAHERSLRPGGEGAAAWLSELVWRDFYAQILWHHPRVVDHAFKAEYDRLPFRSDPKRFAAWCEGRTGYPIVDAGMRELNETGYMHNRLRMITASFLVKDLLVDWRLGERYFAEKLLDYDLASNNGGWQWAASIGCDAQPYFRIFNPVTQSKRFDAEGHYIRRHVPELAALDASDIHAPWQAPPTVQHAHGMVVGRDYPPPLVDHAQARAQALDLFRSAR